MFMSWDDELRQRFRDYENSSRAKLKDNALLISIKIRVDIGCFHREHSPQAYDAINKFLQADSSDSYGFIEHENGPEIITQIEFISSIIIISAAVIDLVNTVIKARTEGIKKGDRPNDDIELITRGFNKKGKLKEEKILRIKTGDNLSKKDLEKQMKKILKEYFEE